MNEWEIEIYAIEIWHITIAEINLKMGMLVFSHFIDNATSY